MHKFLLLCLSIFTLNILSADEKIQTLHFGYYLPSMNDIDAKDIKISLEFWAQELATGANYQLKSHFYNNLNKLKKDLKEEKIDVVSASLLVLAKDFKKGTFQNGFKAVSSNPESQNKLLILARKNSKINSLKDLKNKRILRIKNLDLEALYLNTLLQKSFQKDAKEFFKKNIFVKSYSKAVMQLFFKKADAAIVTEDAFLLASEMNPQIKKQLKVIRDHKINLINGALFRKNVPKHKVKIFTQNALNLHKTARGQQILTVFKADHIIEGKVDDLDKVRILYNQYIALKK